MTNPTLQLGGGNFAVKDGKLLGYATDPKTSVFVSREFDFSRGSNLAATRVDANGLIEKGRENLLVQSNQFDTTWFLNTTSVTSGQSGYDGSSDAWLLNSTATGFPRIQQTISASGVLTLSVYAKAATDGFMLIRTFGADSQVWFNLNNGNIVNSSGTEYVSSKTDNVGNGWYRCSVVFNGSLTSLRFYPASAYGVYSTSGNGIYIQDAQLEAGLVATDYIETGATTAQAGILEDMPRIDYTNSSSPALLLEPQRTNNVQHSEYFGASIWETYFYGGATLAREFGYASPEGKNNAYKFSYTAGSGNNGILLTDNFSATASVDYTLSVWMKGAVGGEKVRLCLMDVSSNGVIGTTFTLTDEWVLYTDTITNSAGTSRGFQFRMQSVIGVDTDQVVYVYGAQAEEASYATSYIPTYGTAVTRGGEGQSSSDLSAELSSALSNAYTLFLDFEVTNNEDTTLNFADIFSFKFDESLSKDAVKIETYHTGGVDSIRAFVYKQSSSTQVTSVAPNVIPMGSRVKLACVLDDSYGVKIFYNGTKIVDHQEITAYEKTKFLKGSGVNGNTRSKTLLNKILTFETALTDQEAIALTTL